MAEIDDSLERLPHTYEKRKDPAPPYQWKLWRFLSIFTREIDQLKQAKEDLRIIRDIDQATGMTLDRIGTNVQQSRGKTEDSVYKTLIKTKIARNINQGDVNNLIEVIAVSMGCKQSEVEVIEKWTLSTPEPAGLVIKPPIQALLNIGLTPAQFTPLMGRMTAGGVSVDGLYRGSFRFSTTYNQPVYNSDKGFNNGTLGAFYSPQNGGDELPL
jgi:hypothetical protein